MGPTQSEEIKNISAEMARLRGALNATPQDVLARPIYNELLRLREKRREIERRLKSASESSAEVESQAQEKSRDPQGAQETADPRKHSTTEESDNPERQSHIRFDS